MVVAGVLALAAAAFLLPPPPAPVHYHGRKVVRFWHMWAAEWGPVVEGICKRFNESQDEYEVVPLYVPADGAVSKFLLSAAGGDTPDLLSQWNPILGTWTDKGLIQPLQDIMTPAEKAQFEREAYPIFRKYATYRGKIMCAVAGIDCNAVYYRLDHLREVGVDRNHLPQTLDELVELGKKLDRKDKDGNLKRVGFLPQGLPNWVPIFGGRFETQPEMLLDTTANLDALQFMVGQVKRLGKDNVARFLAAQPADTGMNAPLLTGNYSILLDGQWKVKQTNEVAPDLDYCVAPLPPGPGGKPLASGTAANYLVIPTAAKCPEGAWAFMKFWIGFTDAEAGGKNIGEMGWLPYCDRVAASKSYKAYVAKYPQFQTFVDLVKSPNLVPNPVGPLQSYVSDQIQKADDAGMHMTLTPEAALKRLDVNVRKEIDHQRRLGNYRD